MRWSEEYGWTEVYWPDDSGGMGHRKDNPSATGQTRKHSFIESWVNVAIGYVINFAANLVILPLFGLQASLGEYALLGLAYTLVSVARSYVVRRWFNRLMVGAR